MDNEVIIMGTFLIVSIISNTLLQKMLDMIKLCYEFLDLEYPKKIIKKAITNLQLSQPDEPLWQLLLVMFSNTFPN